MAIGILKSIGAIQSNIPATTCFIGALSLDGSILPFDGLLSAALGAKALGFRRLYMPFDENLPEIKLEGLEIVYVTSIEDVIQHLSGQTLLPITYSKPQTDDELVYDRDFRDIIGHDLPKRALEIAAAGEHHVFMSGPPGCGKSLLAETFPSILPPLSNEAQLEKVSLYQLAGVNFRALSIPSFRNPHHSASSVSIIGGGQNPKPGEVSLAHRGVLFLDEMGEFSKKTLDMLRQPIETGKVTISRARSIVTYPATFLLIGAMNPCPCGYLGSNSHYCTCTPKQIQSYQTRISGPIRDRFDINLSLESINLEAVRNEGNETSLTIQERVMKARERQYERYGEEICNSRVPYELLLETSKPKEGIHQLMQKVAIKKKWSNRVQVKMLRLARTISDVKGEKDITEESIWEAMTLNERGDQQIHERKAISQFPRIVSFSTER